MNVHLIAATGLSGQIGLDGEIPWHNDPRFEATTRRDLAEFARMTAGGVLVMGSVTAAMLPKNFDPKDREIVVWRRAAFDSPEALLSHVESSFPRRDLWICGGQKVYELFIPYVDWHHISVIPYDGPADRHLPMVLPYWSFETR